MIEMKTRSHGTTARLLPLLWLAACGGSDPAPDTVRDDSPREDTSSGGDGEVIEAMLRGPGAARFTIDPAFANGAEIDAISTYWGCDVRGLERPLRLRFAFAEDGEGLTLYRNAALEDEELRWRAEDNTVALKKRGSDSYRIDLADIAFADDVGFTATFYYSSAEDFELDDRFDTSTPSTLSVECTLADIADGTVLTASPYSTSEGAASWPRPDPEPLERIPSISAMYMVGRLSYSSGTPAYAYSTRIAFDDGTFTSRVDEVARIGIAASRAESPDRWGEWRTAGGSTEFRDDDDEGFSTPGVLWTYEAQPPDATLDECYGSGGSTSIGGLDGNLTVLRVSRFCFGANGVFSHGSTSTTTSPVLIAASGSGDAGTYRLSGFLLELDYADGRRARKLFGGDATTVAVGDGAFLQGL